ncbi:hypothetical protein Tco_0195096 [Tanacetum coccineum]
MLVPVVVEEGEGSGIYTEPQPTPSPTQPSVGDQTHVTESSFRLENTPSPSINIEGTGWSEGDQVQLPHNSPLSGGHTSDKAEGALNLEELFVLCTNLSNRVLALETSKDAQAAKILKLKTRIKKLEKKSKPSISHHRAWLRSVYSLSMKKKFGKNESVSKQGRKNAKPGLTLDDSPFDDLDADLAHGMDYMETKEAVNEGRQKVSTAVPEVSTVNISTASRPKVSTTTQMTPPTTTSMFEDEDIFLADALEEPEPVNVKSKGQDKAQIAIDEEVARQLDEQLQAELERERVAEEEATKAALIREYDEILARINADSIFLAEQRAAAIKNKPPTKSQLRSQMMTYLRHVDFVPIGSAEDKRRIEEMSKKATSKDASKKIKGSPRMKRISKRKKTDSDHEDEEHGAEGIYYRIFRSDGSSRCIKTFSEMLTRFDRLDLVELYNLVMHRFETTTREGVDLALWGDLRIMFDANVEDELWQNQERWNLKSWDFYKNCGIHTLILEDGTEIHMLAERKYPLTKETLEKMMSLKLVAESASDGAYNLLRFIQKKIDESGSYDGSEKDL